MRDMRVFLLLGLLMGSTLVAEPPKKDAPDAKKQKSKPVANAGVAGDSSITIGKPFKVRNVSGVEEEVSLVEKDDKYYLRSTYQHGFQSEVREYLVGTNVEFAHIVDRGIDIFFARKPDAKIAGVVFIINGHGEALKVDDITQTDLTW